MMPLPALDDLIAAIRLEAALPQYQVSAAQPMVAESFSAARPAAAVSGDQMAAHATPVVVAHVDELLLISDNVQFVDAAYRTLLRREPDAYGMQSYVAKLQQGYGQMFVLAALRASAEARQQGVALSGFGLAPWVYNGWRVGRRLGLGAVARVLSGAYSAWRHVRLVASGRVAARLFGQSADLVQCQVQVAQLRTGLDQAGGRLDSVQGQLDAAQGRLAAQGSRLDVAQGQLAAQGSQLDVAQGQLAAQGGRLDVAQGQLAAQGSRLDVAQGQLAAQGSQLDVVLEQQQRLAALTSDLQAQAVQGRFDSQLLRVRLLTLQQRGAAMGGSSAAAAVSAPVSHALAGDPQVGLQTELDDYYLAFENAHRGSHAEITAKLAAYLPQLAQLPEAVLGLPMVDLGCGRGEWLDVLVAQGFDARGLDMSAAMVQHCVGRGLQVLQADALQWLRVQPANGLALVSGFHIVEHLPFEVLFELVAQAWRVLAPGGVLVVETPNPESVLVGSHTFYHDHSHRNPITPTALQFLLGYHGFVAQQVLRLNPYPSSDRVQESGLLAERFNNHLYGPQDYGVVAHKP